MFENPSGKLRIIVRICIYICMIASMIISVAYVGPLAILIFPVLWFIWWIVGLFWLLRIEHANDVHEIRMFLEERVQSKPAPVNGGAPKRNIKMTTSGTIGTETVCCPSCGKSQFAGNKKCFACGAEISKPEK